MTLAGFEAKNHPQQVGRHGALDDIDDRATEAGFFAGLHERFRFTVDVAAAEHNAKVPRFYDRRADGLARSWADERVWCNPPFSSIPPWVEKAWSESRAELVVMLLPANRTEQGWWQTLIEPFRDRPGSVLRVEFIAGRLRFMKPGVRTIEADNRPPFGCCLAIWQPCRPPSRVLDFDGSPFRATEQTQVGDLL